MREENPLLEYCLRMNISYSYKPVLIRALMEHGGTLHLAEAVRHFVEYYRNRLSQGLLAERDNSIFSHLNCSFEQVATNIKKNPLKAILRSGFFNYDSEEEVLSIKPSYRECVSQDVAMLIIAACDQRLDYYYGQLMKTSQPEVLCFYHAHGKYGCFSNWSYSRFTDRGRTFTSVEQYMMYRKAMLFCDDVAKRKIMATDDVRSIKQFGREVKHYNERIWNGNRQLVVFRGLLAKFEQNEGMKEVLLSTGSSVIAECSPNDKIWGIGLSMNDERRLFIDQWKGQNLLGFSLMEVRNRLIETMSL